MTKYIPLKQKYIIAKSAIDYGFDNNRPAESEVYNAFDARVVLQLHAIALYEDIEITEDMDAFGIIDDKMEEGYEMPADYEEVLNLYQDMLSAELTHHYSLQKSIETITAFDEDKIKDTLAQIEALEQKESEVLGDLKKII